MLLAALDLHAESATPPTLLARLAHMNVPAPAAHGLALSSPAVAGSIAAALVVGGSVALALWAPWRHAPAAPSPAALAAAAPVSAAAPAPSAPPPPPAAAAVPAPLAVAPAAAPAAPARFAFRPDLDPGSWHLKGLTGAASHPVRAGQALTALELACVPKALVGIATISTPTLPDAYAVEFLVHIKTVLCPFTSVWIEPGLAGVEPLVHPLREIDIDTSTIYPRDSWERVRCEFHRTGTTLSEDVTVDGRAIRHLDPQQVPAATDSITLRVIDTDCEIADLSVTSLGAPPKLQPPPF
jgi:hypothetical protein